MTHLVVKVTEGCKIMIVIDDYSGTNVDHLHRVGGLCHAIARAVAEYRKKYHLTESGNPVAAPPTKDE